MNRLPPIQSQITFLYYRDLEPAAHFYAEIMGFALVTDQGFAKIYRTAGGAYVGIVDGEKGSLRPQERNAVMISLCVDDVVAWHDHLKGKGVKILSEPKEHDSVQLQGFFFEDPGGYTLELQRFLEPEMRRIFHGSAG